MNDRTFTNKLDIAEQFNNLTSLPINVFFMSSVDATQVCWLFQKLNENELFQIN